MLFNSADFAVFFAVVYGLYLAFHKVPRGFRFQNTLLLVAGYVFYGWWDVRFLYLIAFSTVVDFNIGLMLGTGRVPVRQRVISSAFLVSAAAICLCVNWSAVSVSLWPMRFGVDWPKLAHAPSTLGIYTLIGTIVAVAIGNLAYPKISALDEPRRRKLLLFLTVFVNLTFLGVFKYFNFFIDSAEAALAAIGWKTEPWHLSVALPVGISFYTFQSLSYTIDAARGLVKPAEKFRDFALFVAFFPPMVAGPIERGAHLLPQLLKPRVLLPGEIQAGLWLIAWGFFKKMVIADNLSTNITQGVFGKDYADFAGLDLLLGILAFSVQIYCDFSGYTDIARGVGKLMGFDIMLNFRLPYFALNPSDFWRRWHISLSSWLRDYLYIPLGGNRGSAFATYRNLFLTMLLGGLWHGASWNFVLWGAFHGLILILYRLVERRDDSRDPWGDRRRIPIVVGKLVLMYALTQVGWTLFACHSLAQIRYVFSNVGFTGSGKTPLFVSDLIFFVTPLLAMQLAQYVSRDLLIALRLPLPLRAGLIGLIVVWTIIFASRAPTEFIYFQF